LNLYQYVANDPINYKDPTGECTIQVIIAAAVIAALIYEAWESARHGEEQQPHIEGEPIEPFNPRNAPPVGRFPPPPRTLPGRMPPVR
jgi:hypothetical protein